MKKKDKRFFLAVILVILALLSGTRYQLGGSDFIVYKAAYDSIPTLKDFLLNFRELDNLYTTFGFEKGYLFICSLIKSFGFNFYGFTLIHALFFYFCLYKFIRKNSYSYLIMISIFLYKIFFYNTFISMRQSITLALFLLAIEYIKNKSLGKYIFTILIAVTMHSAAIILLPLYFINRINFTKKKIITLNLVFLPTLLLSFSSFSPLSIAPILFSWFPSDAVIGKIESYALKGMTSRIGILHIIEYFIIMFILIFNFSKIKEYKNSNVFIGLFLCLLPIFTLFSGYEIFTRFKDYFTLTYGIILGMLLVGGGKYKIVIKILIFTICMAGVFRFIILFDNGAFYEYRSYIFRGIPILGEVNE
ncbi:EpsG family protein [Lysinibacillus fusiformis]